MSRFRQTVQEFCLVSSCHLHLQDRWSSGGDGIHQGGVSQNRVALFSSGQSSVSLLLSAFWIHFGGIRCIDMYRVYHGIPWYTQFAESQHPAADSCRKQALMKSPLPEEKLLRRLTRTASSKKNEDSSLNSAKICMLIDDIWWSLMIVDAFLQTFYIFFFASVGQDEWHRRLKEARLGFALVSPLFPGDVMRWSGAGQARWAAREVRQWDGAPCAWVTRVLPFISSYSSSYRGLLGYCRYG